MEGFVDPRLRRLSDAVDAHLLQRRLQAGR